jgi:1L-myo-inositol 1-phosphate cytidylyltransferase
MSLTTKTALILAAGNGSRLATASGSMPKPLVELHGRPLLEHVLLGARDAGIERFVIVAGFRAQAVRSWVADRHLFGVDIDVVENPEYKTKANGISVLRARYAIAEPFLLLMSDHLFEPETAAALLEESVEDGSVILAIDRKLHRIFDMDDATKVLCAREHIVGIGKQLPSYNAVDTGMFLCSPAVFSALERATVDGDCSLSDGMRLMAQAGKLRAFDIGDALWQDVDTPETLAYAELLFAEPHGPRVDFAYA